MAPQDKPHFDCDAMPLDVLKGRADGILATYHSSHSVGDLEEAIGVYEEILQQCPPEQERRAGALSDLGDALYHFCLNHEAENARNSRCIQLLREALRLRPAGHPLRDQSLHTLARALHFILYHQLDSLDILEECVSLNREALRLRPAGHPERLKSMNNLANDLAAIVEHTGDMDMQIEMVSMRREVLRMRPHGHPQRHISLDVLGNALCTSFELSGRSEVLAEAISMLREAVQILPNGHPQCVKALSNLACALWLRAVYEGHLESLSESIDCTREALQLLAGDHPLRARIMNNLANSLIASFRNSGDVNMLSTAISLLREAVRLLSPGSYSRDGMINNLAEALEAKFHVDSDAAALSQAASLHRDALNLRPVGHPRRFLTLEGLGRVLGQSGCWWSEALSCYQEALQVCPTGSPGRARLLCGMSKCFLNPDSPSFSLLDGISCLSEAYADPLLHVNARLKSAIVDLQQLEAAYNSSRKDAYTKSHAHEEGQILDLYAQVIGLLPLAANFGLDHSVRLQAVTGFDEITRNAAARAVLIGHLPQAVTLLEQGRGVFWTQTLHLRSPAFDGVNDNDCQELERMLRLLDHGACRVEGLQLASAQRESQLEKRRQLNEAVQTLIFKIRRCPGLDRFLLPPAFDALLGSLPDGFVVIVNASKLGHHALLLHRATKLTTSLILEPSRADFDFATLRAQLPRDMMELSEHDGEIGYRAMRLDNGRSVDNVEEALSVLWISVVQPVVQALGLHEAQGRARPRLWWCVTGELGFLPMHAAGRKQSGCETSIADYVVSSYTPTLASLTKARRQWAPIPRSDLAGLLICETSTHESSTKYLSHAFDEVSILHDCFASAGAQVLNQPTAHTSLSELRMLLEGSPAHILHMACHGIQASDPLKSSFLLHDGTLSIEDIIQLKLPRAFMAFLSACQTAKGDRNAPDQAVHLAASMLFCGFKSVVGTMWSMCDEDGPKVSQRFYTSLFAKAQVEMDDIAYALDEAVRELRRSRVPASRWAPFMHIGG